MADQFDITTDAVLEEESSKTEGVYGNEEAASAAGEVLHEVRGDTSDEIDPRKLVRDPSLSELRWYYRRTFAKVLVNKPVDDAFKNSFEFVGNNAEEASRLISRPSFDSGEVEDGGFDDAFVMAQKKARRDGFAIIFIGTRDDSAGVHVSPIGDDVTVDEITHFKVHTIDNLASTGTSTTHEQIQEGTGLEQDQYVIRETGIVVNTDVGSQDYNKPIGYLLEGNPPTFIHKDRTRHYTWNAEVDGDYKSQQSVSRWKRRGTTLGMWEGDSVLVPSYDLMKGISKGNWAVMQALYRNASHMYTVTLPEDADEDDQDWALKETRNINAKSSMVFPGGYEINQHASGSEMDPTDFYEAIFEQVCAVHEMTKSVLFGTQAGTVSGSEVDIKNYFSKVERLRSGRFQREVKDYLTHAKRILDGRTSTDFTYETEIEWGPLFKVDEETRLSMFQTATQALTTAIGNYVLTPDEARSILSSEFAEIDFDDLTEDQMDVLDRLNLAQVGQAAGAEANDPSPDIRQSNPRTGGQAGGRPSGARQSSGPEGATPATDEAIDGELVDAIAEKVADKLTEDRKEPLPADD